jgi:hypothetical protein
MLRSLRLDFYWDQMDRSEALEMSGVPPDFVFTYYQYMMENRAK